MDVGAELRAALADRYRLERELGRGATAVVYLARDLRHDRDVAIKVLHPELTRGYSGDRFLREIQISASLQHPHILALYDSGQAEGCVYCVMRYVQGETLRARLARERALSIEDAIRFTRQVADALAYAHLQGVVHRDIKPENILLDDGTAFVADFGIAHSVTADTAERLTLTGTSLGTPHYMSPEQAAGERNVDGRSDLYSLACVTYEMLTGEPPFDGPNAQAVIARHLQQPVTSLRILRKTVPEHVDEAVQRALAKSPADRFRDPAAFAAALEDAELRPTRVNRTAMRRRPVGMVVAAAGLLALAAVGARAAWETFATPALDGDLVAVAPFDVNDAALAPWREGLLDLLAQNLNGAGPLKVVPPSRVVPDWDGRADEFSALSLGRGTGAGASVVGAVHPNGADSVRLTAAVYDITTRRLLGDLRVVVPVGRVDHGADSLTVGILGVLARERPLGSTRPPSQGTSAIAALKAYLQGEVAFRRMDWEAARPLYERAAQLDTNYAMAYHRLSLVRTMRGSGIDSLIWFNGLRAGRLNRGLSERDSLMLAIDSLQAALWYVITVPDVSAADSLSALLSTRLFETHEVTTRRFPGDAEFWYRQAVNLSHFAGPSERRAHRVLEALDRSIALDSSNLPAYGRAINLAATLEGEAAARRHIAAFLSRAPEGPAAEEARLKALLLDPARSTGPEAERALATTRPAELLASWSPLLWTYDSAQTAVRIAERILAHPDAAQLDPRGLSYPQFVLALSLASRGRVSEACDVMPPPGQWILASQLAVLQCAPADSMARRIALLADMYRRQPARLVIYLPWWYAQRDMTRLEAMRRLGDSVSRAGVDAASRAAGRSLAASALGWVALAAGDSVSALARFAAVPDSLCEFCDAQRLARAELLAAQGRERQAVDALGVSLDDNSFPLAFLMRLKRAHLLAALSLDDRARDDYSRVARAWATGDPAMRDSAAVARRALERLKP
jgi:tRNA A-37 threonylcarbamoyl transferase component Bud32/AraC-like DNA-binding protein